MIVCPSCSKEFPDADACPRCGCETGVLLHIARTAARLAATAAVKLFKSDYAAALDLAEASLRLRRSGLAARIALLAAVARDEKKRARRLVTDATGRDGFPV